MWLSDAARQSAGIDAEAARRDLCVRLVISSLQLPDPLQATVPSDLDVTFGLLFSGHPEEQLTPARVSFSGVNASFGKASPANSDAQGQFTLAVAAFDSSAPVTLFLQGCLVIDGQVEPWVCVDEVLTRNDSAGPLGRRWAGTVGLSMTESRLSIEYAGNQRIQWDRQIDVSAAVDVELPPGATVVLPLTGVSGTMSTTTTTVIVEEQDITRDGITCRNRATQTTVQASSGGDAATFENLRLRLEADGRYTFGPPEGGVIRATASSTQGSSSGQTSYVALSATDANGEACPAIDTVSWMDQSSGSVTALFWEPASGSVSEGRMHGARRLESDLSVPDGSESGAVVTTLSWSLAPR